MGIARIPTAASLAAMIIAGGLAAAPAMAQDVSADAGPITGNPDDIIVTATKRNESIRNVPIPMSAISGEQLAKANANSLADYINRLPGVVFNDYQPGISEVVIRGIAATTYHEQGQTTVGYYLNQVPIVEPGFPIGIPDIDTFDLERVEVLRGPQGTLFGSSTLGGLVNYIVNTADTTKVDAAASGLIGSTRNASGGLNYAGKAMINIPIIQDKLAVRVMGLQRHDAGYIDNVSVGRNASNDFRTRGLRGSIVATPTETTKITYLSTYQDTKLDDQTYLTSLSALTRVVPREEPQRTTFFLNTLRLDKDLGFATFTLFGSVDKKTNHTVFSYPYGYVTGVFTGPNAAYGPGRASANIKTVEGRLASAGDGPFHWLIGASYLRARKNSYDQIIAPGAEAFINANRAQFGGVSGGVLAPGDRVYGYLANSLNEDLGIFGELSYKPVQSVELTVGGRYYDTKARANVVNQAGFVSGSLVDLAGSTNQKEDGFTPKVTLTVRPTDQFMAYATYSKGFRVGGINPNAGLLTTIQSTYQSDKTNNYEAGVKFTAIDRRLNIDATVFHIDWNNIQARLFGPAPSYYSFVTNAGGAKIEGVEFAGRFKVLPILTVSSNATYQNAQLSEFLPDTFAVGGGYDRGTRLPGSSHWTVANNVVLDIPDMALQPTIEFAHRYISKAPVAFGNPNTRGGFSQFDARASITLFEKFRFLGFINNIADKRGVLNAPFTSQFAPAYSIIRPRTYGLRIDWSL